MSSATDDGTHRLAAVVAVLAGLSLAILSAIIAWRFGSIIGASPTDQGVVGALGITLGITKVCLTFGLYAAWRQRRWILLAGCAAAFAACVLYGLSSSFGYAAAQRAPSERESESLAFKRTELEALPKHRPAAAVAPLVEAERDRAKRAVLRSELAIAKEAERLKADMGAEPLTESGAQLAELSQALALPIDVVRARWLALLAITLELGELTLFMVASSLWWGRGPRTRAVAPAPAIDAREIVFASILQTEPTPAVDAPATQPRRMTAGNWIEAHLQTGADVLPADAYDLYRAEWARRRRKPLTKSRFGKMLDRVARKMGASRKAQAGRLSYRLAA